MARPKKVSIEHKELGLGPSEVLEESLSGWLRGGWTLVDDKEDDEDLFLDFDDDTDDPDEPGDNEE